MIWDSEKRPKKKIEASKWVFIFGGWADLIWHLLSHHKTLFFLVPKWLFFLQVLDIFRSQHPWPGDLEAVGKMNGFWLCRVSPCSQVCDVYDNVFFRVFRTVALNLPVSDWAYFSGKQKPRAFMSYHFWSTWEVMSAYYHCFWKGSRFLPASRQQH